MYDSCSILLHIMKKISLKREYSAMSEVKPDTLVDLEKRRIHQILALKSISKTNISEEACNILEGVCGSCRGRNVGQEM